MIKKTLMALMLPLMFMSEVEAKSSRGQDGYDFVSRAAKRYNVPEWLAHAVIHIESGHRCSARNRSGASGLGQLMPGTARALGLHNSMNCAQNADASIRYLSRFFHLSGGNACASASAYNRGSLSGCTSYGRKVTNKRR